MLNVSRARCVRKPCRNFWVKDEVFLGFVLQTLAETLPWFEYISLLYSGTFPLNFTILVALRAYSIVPTLALTSPFDAGGLTAFLPYDVAVLLRSSGFLARAYCAENSDPNPNLTLAVMLRSSGFYFALL